MTEVAGVIPFSAWEQAVFYVLLTVFVVYVFSWIAKQNKEARDHAAKESVKAREFQEAQSEKWQKFIFDLNANLQEQNRVDREKQNCAMADVNKGLTNLTQVTQGLVTEIREMRAESREVTAALALHDDQAKEIKHLVEVNNKPTPKPRTKKAAGPLE